MTSIFSGLPSSSPPLTVSPSSIVRHTAESRENTTGLIADMLVATITHTDRSGITLLISVRPASRQEICFLAFCFLTACARQKNSARYLKSAAG